MFQRINTHPACVGRQWHLTGKLNALHNYQKTPLHRCVTDTATGRGIAIFYFFKSNRGSGRLEIGDWKCGCVVVWFIVYRVYPLLLHATLPPVKIEYFVENT